MATNLTLKPPSIPPQHVQNVSDLGNGHSLHCLRIVSLPSSQLRTLKPLVGGSERAVHFRNEGRVLLALGMICHNESALQHRSTAVNMLVAVQFLYASIHATQEGFSPPCICHELNSVRFIKLKFLPEQIDRLKLRNPSERASWIAAIRCNLVQIGPHYPRERWKDTRAVEQLF